MKNNKIFIIVAVIVAVLTSTITAYATTYLYNANEVSYDNSNSNISATNVQGAINELYDTATDYSSINTRVTGLESYFQNNPGTEFNSYQIQVGKNSGSVQSNVSLYYNGVNRGSLILSTTGNKLMLGPRDSSSTWAKGELGLYGDTIDVGASSSTVNIAGINYSSVSTYTGDTTSGLTLKAYKIGKVVFIIVTGTTTENIANNAYFSIGTLPEGYRPPVNFVNYKFYNGTYIGQFNVSTSGLVRLGYGRKIVAPTTNTGIPSGQSVYLNLSYVASQ